MEEYLDNDIPPYAILSHTWGSSEIDFCEWQRGQPAKNKDGYAKIIAAQNQARKDGLKYLWVDTCCIDKRSSAELSEAINSMFAWYRDSSVCYAFLADVQIQQFKQGCRGSESVYPATIKLEDLKGSRWFTRGWTLQELLAPRQVQFFSGSWICLGTKESLAGMISEITLIHVAYLVGDDIRTASIAQRMAWASGRITKRLEDIAYGLMGIFDVNMPLLYGEKHKAFIRLQEEILKKSNDESIFAWGQQGRNHESNQRYGLLATSPKEFSASATIIGFPEEGRQLKTTNTAVLLQRFDDFESDPSPDSPLYVRLQVRDLKQMTSYICLPVEYAPEKATYCRVSVDYPAYISPRRVPLAAPRRLQTKSWDGRRRDIDNILPVSKEQPIVPKRLSQPTFDIVVKHSYPPHVNDKLPSHKNSSGCILPLGFTGSNTGAISGYDYQLPQSAIRITSISTKSV
ncbi:hypothetical protein NW762_014382 [Fusarium torreyae]|uniref:Heterokaryon incompatibility domain-containing protein n=1 Tax=Fusarium torreyae TaxID=1237075 RepID=A0A9W8RK91_9HYPO|nr:hypothetical protein NW762_014382 [Fusarium torreyae]